MGHGGEGGITGYSETWKKKKVQGVLRNRRVMEKVCIYSPFAHPYAGFAPRAAATLYGVGLSLEL